MGVRDGCSWVTSLHKFGFYHSCIQMFGLPKMANRDFFGFSFSSVTVVVVDAHKSRRVHNFVYDILCCCTKDYLPAPMGYVLGYQQKSVKFRPQRIRIW